VTKPPTYRFSPLDTTGWLYGLTGEQCLTLVGGIVLSGVALDAHATPLIVIVPVTIAVIAAFARVKGGSVFAFLSAELHLLYGRLSHTSIWQATDPEALPPYLHHLIWEQAKPSDDSPGIVVNPKLHTLSATIQVSAKQFVLCEPDVQQHLLDGWGDAIGAFATERSPVSAVSWCESTVRAQPRTTHPRLHSPSSSAALTSYMNTMHEASLRAEVHTTSVTLTVDMRRTRGDNKTKEGTLRAGISSLLDELRLFSTRLTDAGLVVSPPLTLTELRELNTTRLSPMGPATSRRSTLGRATRHLKGPHISGGSTERGHVKVDDAYHRAYWIRQWPRTDLNANWMEPLLLHPGVNRSITIHLEPISASSSRRHIDRSATKLETDAIQQTRSGFRIGDNHRRAAQAVSDRETELGSGFAEFAYFGIIVVTATDSGELRSACLDFEQTSSACGIDLRPLDGRHELGLACSLPLGQAGRRKWLS
jgi:hypothetical protein